MARCVRAAPSAATARPAPAPARPRSLRPPRYTARASRSERSRRPPGAVRDKCLCYSASTFIIFYDLLGCPFTVGTYLSIELPLYLDKSLLRRDLYNLIQIFKSLPFSRRSKLDRPYRLPTFDDTLRSGL